MAQEPSFIVPIPPSPSRKESQESLNATTPPNHPYPYLASTNSRQSSSTINSTTTISHSLYSLYATNNTGSGKTESPFASTDPEKDLKDPNFDPSLIKKKWLCYPNKRGLVTMLLASIIGLALIGGFAGYPLGLYINHEVHQSIPPKNTTTNTTEPRPPTIVLPIDPDTPASAHQKLASDGTYWDLVFSDEFNQDGRTFYPGSDPYWGGRRSSLLGYWRL
ncbi:hypothetical protein BZG36_03728 [Bifiguratus adelaidae]|uniref:Uncharacterized protein n=1 Tax=Bifiguratus adelaidae TaxID=1938954 RepID=A0A261XZ85_9FUNG|nr:hypothetical protein BZG36_03728 [Bifiguratus adelaidae]